MTFASVSQLGSKKRPTALKTPITYMPRIGIAPCDNTQAIGPRVR